MKSRVRVMILGGTGLLSRGVTDACVARGHEVIHFTRGRRPADPRAHWIAGDRDREADLVAAAALRPDVVIDMLCFTAAQAAAATRAFGGRIAQLVLCSTACVYDLGALARAPRLADESTPTASRWHYGRAKAEAEAVVVDAERRGLFRTTIFRPSHVYGDGAVVHQLGTDGLRVLFRVARGLPVLVLDGGTARWQACHASDAGVPFAAACLAPRFYGGVYHVAHGEVLTWLDVVRAFGRAVGREPRIASIASDVLERRARPDADEFALEVGRHGLAVDAARVSADVPGFRRTVPFDEGLRRAWRAADPPPSLAYDAELERMVLA